MLNISSPARVAQLCDSCYYYWCRSQSKHEPIWVFCSHGICDGAVGMVPSPLLPSSRNPLPGHTEWTWALPGAWHFLPGLLKEGQGTESRPQCVPSGSCPSPPEGGGGAPDKELRAWDLVLGPSSGRREGLGDGWRSF